MATRSAEPYALRGQSLGQAPPVPWLRRRGLFGKRVFDLIVCVLALPIIIPLLLVCAAAIRIDSPGPVIFTQLRTGRHGIRFRMFKFRTMDADAESQKASLSAHNALPYPDFKVIDDPRVTKVGRFLRKSSLDELPQVINVFLGEMSLVGPRPTSFAPSTYDLWHGARLEVPPGITGLWQVKGRNTATFDERARLDIEYMRNMSFALDVKILLMTVAAVFRGEGE